MTQATLTPTAAAPATVTLDVFADDANGLRRRLQQRPASFTASLLPGGMIYEETESACTYRLGGLGGWQLEERDGEFHLSNALGHRVVLRDGQMSVSIAK